MKTYTPDKLRTIAVCGHGSVGKTSLCDSLVFRSGGAERQGSVDDGTSLFDYTTESREKKHSLTSTVGICEWNDTKINLIDTPGLADFHGDTIAAISASDGALIVLDCTDAVEVGSYKTWKYAEEMNTPCMLFVNRVDRDNADFERALLQAREMLSKAVIPFVFPIMESDGCKGLVHLLTGKAYDLSGKEIPLPASSAEKIEEYMAELTEQAAEADEELMEQYFANDSLTPEELARGIRGAVSSRGLFPLFAGVAIPAAGQEALLDGILQCIPSALEFRGARVQGGDILQANPRGPFVARAFSTKLDRHVGEMVYIRVVSGALEGSKEVHNMEKNSGERLGNYYHMHGPNRVDASSMVCGDIIAVAKLKNTSTNDTLADKSAGITLTPIVFPNPVYRAAIAPKKRGEEDKMGVGLNKLASMDLTFISRMEPDINQTTVSGMGELHLNTMLNRLKDLTGVDAEIFKPRIAYHETISKSAQGSYKHKKQSGGRGQYGHVYLRLDPLPRGTGFQFTSEVVGGTVPTKFIPAVEKGVLETLHKGPVSGSRVVDVKAVVFDGSSHSVDSSDMAFKLASSKCFQEVMMQAGPTLLEPIMALEVTVPEEFMGDVMGDLNSRRGKIQGMEGQGAFQIIKALVPEAELYQYTSSLRSLTQARGSFTQEFSHYDPVPREVQDRIQAEYKSDEQ